MNRYERTGLRDWVRVAIAIGLYLTATIAALFLLGPAWFVVIAAIGLLALVSWHTRSYAYRCGKCGREFEISLLRNLASPHWPDRQGGRKLLRCPDCRAWGAAQVVRIERR